MQRLVYLFLLTLIGFGLNAQDLFVKQEGIQGIDDPQLELTSDNGSIVAATYTRGSTFNSTSIYVRRFDACGNVLWSKIFAHATTPIDLVEMQKDGNGNFLMVGNFGMHSAGGAIPYLLSIKEDGSVNFFKTYETTTTNFNIVYSMGVAPNNDYYIYVNYNTNTSQLNQLVSLLKLRSDGSIRWFKNYQFNGSGIVWGRAGATKDGGMLSRSGSVIFKTDSVGDIDWGNRYLGLRSVGYPVDADSGYAMYSYSIGAIDRSYLFMLNRDGSIRWNTPISYDFYPQRALVRKNGNVLFAGGVQRPFKLSGLVEMNPNDGSVIGNHELESASTNQLIWGSDVIEDEDENVVISSISTAFVTDLYHIKVNDSLSLVNCQRTAGNFSTDQPPLSIQNVEPISVLTNTDIREISETIIITDTFGLAQTVSCSYTEVVDVPFLGNDTLICPKADLVLGANLPNYPSYLWSTGATSRTIRVGSAGDYWLKVPSACDTLSDTIKVQFYPVIGLELGADTNICDGDTVTLGQGLNLNNYLWSTGATTPTIQVVNSGIYWLETQTNCGPVRDSILINKLPPIGNLDLGTDTSICPGEPLLLNPGFFPNYLWSDGSRGDRLSVNSSGQYWVEVNNGCDTLSDTIQVNVHPELVPQFEVRPLKAKTLEEIMFNSFTLNAGNVQWLMGDGTTLEGEQVTYRYKLPGIYEAKLRLTSIHGCDFDSVFSLEIIPSELIIPNIFTPNNDGVNDVFAPQGNDVEHFEIQVFNRWGKKVYDNQLIPWNGKNADGYNLSEGVYQYRLFIRLNTGEEILRNGEVTLLR